ncbi:MAG: response regulator [Acidobacteriota bacterium]
MPNSRPTLRAGLAVACLLVLTATSTSAKDTAEKDTAEKDTAAKDTTAATDLFADGRKLVPVTQANGLEISGPAYVLHQDRRGFLWYGNALGLHRFDGYELRTIEHQPGDARSLPPGPVHTLSEDPEGDLWMLIGRRAICRVGPHETVPTCPTRGPTPSLELPTAQSTDLLATADRVWIATMDGLYQTPTTPVPGLVPGPSADPRVTAEPVPDDPQAAVPETLRRGPIAALAADHDALLVARPGRGLFRFEPSTGAVRPVRSEPGEPLHGAAVWALHRGADALWIGTLRAVHRLDTSGHLETFTMPWTVDPTTAADDRRRRRIIALHESTNGRLWIGTTFYGLLALDPDRRTLETYRAEEPVWRKASISSILQDRAGDLWIGGWALGPHRRTAAPPLFEVWRHDRDEPGTAFTPGGAMNVHSDAHGGLWVSNIGGLNRVDLTNGRVERFVHDPDDPTSAPRASASSFLNGPDGTLWIGSWGSGLARFDRARRAFEIFNHRPDDPGSLPTDTITALENGPGDTLWVGTARHGVVLYDPAPGVARSFARTAADRHGPKDDGRVHTLDWLAAPRMLVLGTDFGLDLLDPETGAYSHLDHDGASGEAHGTDAFLPIASLRTRDGGLWLGSQGQGLGHFDAATRQLTIYSKADGLPSHFISALAEDDAGRLWLSTSEGIAVHEADTAAWRLYDARDGLGGTEFWARAAAVDRRGTIYFGADHGVTTVSPWKLPENAEPPPLEVVGLRVLGRTVDGHGLGTVPATLRLGPHQGTFALAFAALDFRRPDTTRYRYRLDDFDSRWQEADSRLARYTNVPPGRYVLEVSAKSRSSGWSPPLQVRVAVAPPWWRTGWALGLFALAFVGVLLLVRRSSRRELRRQRAVAERLAALDRLKDEFLASVSHELRTPLFGIAGLVEAALERIRDRRTREDLRAVHASSRRLAALVDDLLDMRTMSLRGVELHRRAVDLHALVDIVLTLSKPLVGSKDVALRNAVADDLPPVSADAGRLEQILHNLVGNAIKFTDAGHVEVSAAVREDEDRMTVVVRDTGIGIPSEQQGRIFDLFVQAAPSSERQYGGTGLGLAVTRHLVERHGGEITVESVEGEGTSFSFSLALARDEARPGPDEPVDLRHRWLDEPVEAIETRETGTGHASDSEARENLADDAPTVLVVDDEPVNRRVLSRHLGAEGYRVRQATSGREALDELARQVPDLVLLDVMMPRMSGFEVCREIRRHHDREDLPVLFLTAKNQAEDRIAGFEEGGNDYLLKPVPRGELVMRVALHLELLAAHRQLLGEVETLSGLLPICASCKRVRDDDGFWNQVEEYIASRSAVEFTHGMCPDCVVRLYGDLLAAEPTERD